MKLLITSPLQINSLRVARRCLASGYQASHSPGSWRLSSSSSNSRWKQRQGRDAYARDAKVQGLKSRAAFKLLEMDEKHRLFKSGQTVIDLGFAPGSWSQVALERTKPHGQVVGIDLLPAQPPRGVTTFQGDFLSPMVQKLVKDFLLDMHRRRVLARSESEPKAAVTEEAEQHDIEPQSYIDMERQASQVQTEEQEVAGRATVSNRIVDVVLSDMSAPWEQTSGYNVNTLSNPYHRLMNTSGVAFRDHAGSMDLCNAALRFASDALKPGGHFVCKFYQGSEDKRLEQQIKKLFTKVYREKPDSSRSESKEAYLIGLKRKANVTLEEE